MTIKLDNPSTDRLPGALLWVAAGVTIAAGIVSWLAMGNGRAGVITLLFVLAVLVVTWHCAVSALATMCLARFGRKLHKRTAGHIEVKLGERIHSLEERVASLEEELVDRIDRLQVVLIDTVEAASSGPHITGQSRRRDTTVIPMRKS